MWRLCSPTGTAGSGSRSTTASPASKRSPRSAGSTSAPGCAVGRKRSRASPARPDGRTRSTSAPGWGCTGWSRPPATTASPRSSRVDAVDSATWALLPPAPGETGPLFIGSSEGLFRLDPSAAGPRVRRVWRDPQHAAFALLRDPHDPALLWVGGSSALFGLREVAGDYAVVHRHDVGDSVRSLRVDGQGGSGRVWAPPACSASTGRRRPGALRRGRGAPGRPRVHALCPSSTAVRWWA